MYHSLFLCISILFIINHFHIGYSLVFKRYCKIFQLGRMKTMMSTSSEIVGTPLQIEAVSKFITNSNNIQFKSTTGGVSNFMSYVILPDLNENYVLRIYNNGKNSKKVRFEHAIMNQLPNTFSFSLPQALVSNKNPSQTHELLSSGDEACMFRLIPGTLPKLTCVEEIGSASGQLNTALAKVVINEPPQIAPYYKLYEVHHAINRDLFYSTINSQAFDSAREDISRLVKHIISIEQRITELLKEDLPIQLIHGDLHYDNVLVVDGKVSGLLDFEYATYDWRAMELAVCLSKYAGEKDPLPYFDLFLSGYSKHGMLSEKEIELIPDLIVLRILSNVVFFVGRTITGEDTASSLTTRAALYSARVEWIYTNKNRIIDMIKIKMVHK